MKDTFLQLRTLTKERKKKCDWKHIVFVSEKLEGSHIKLTTEIAQKSRDSMLLIGARVQVKNWQNLLLLIYDFLRVQISGWIYIYMSVGHIRMYWTNLYMYEVDLLCVWIGWGASINHTSQSKWETDRMSYCHFSLWDPAYISLDLHQYSIQPQLQKLKHFIYVWSGPAMSMKWVGCPN